MNSENTRRYEIDLLKAVAILTVVALHSISQAFVPTDSPGQFLSEFFRFAIPGLLFASGFLFNHNYKIIRNLDIIQNRFLRIIPPYLLISFFILFAEYWRKGIPSAPETLRKILFDLVIGNTNGTYYFVFVIMYLYIFSLALKKAPLLFTGFLWVLSLFLLPVFYAEMSFFIPPNNKLFFHILFRHPLVHLPAYLSGWIFAEFYASCFRNIRKDHCLKIIILIFLDISFLWLCQGITDNRLAQPLIHVHAFIAICIIIAIGIKSRKHSSFIQFLSNSSFSIFLIHIFIVRYVQSMFAVPLDQFSIIPFITSWTAGVFISIAIAMLFKQLLGKKSYYITGY